MAVMYNLLAGAGLNDTQYTIYLILSISCLALLFIAAVVAILVVLFQQSNSDGIQGITASSETFYGKNKGQSIEYKLKKWTWISLIVLAILSILVYVVQLMVS